MVLCELLLHLSGHSSPLFLAPAHAPLHPLLAPHLHPGEAAALRYLAALAHDARVAREWATRCLDETRRRARKAAPGVHAAAAREEEEAAAEQQELMLGNEEAAVAAAMLRRLQLWDADVQRTLEDVLRWRAAPQKKEEDGKAVGEMSSGNAQATSLAALQANFSTWQAPLRTLAALAEQLGSPPSSSSLLARAGDGGTTGASQASTTPTRWRPGPLLDVLAARTAAAVGPSRTHLEALLLAAESVWMRRCRSWMCDLRPAGLFVAARVEEQEAMAAARGGAWTWAPLAVPRALARQSAEAILSVGRALRALPRSVALPGSLREAHRALLLQEECRLSTPIELQRRVEMIRDEVGEWMWGNVLRPQDVREAVEGLGLYFLHRSGLFHTSFLSELAQLKRSALLSRTAASGTIRAADVEAALHRAAALSDTPSELLSHVRVSVAKGRTVPVAFSDVPLGMPFVLAYTPPYPLDLLFTTQDASAYSQLCSYLLALRSTATRLRETWTRMSKAQRVRRRFTGAGEGGSSRAEEQARATLLRKAWGTAREGLWVLEALTGHFQTDIIDVQYTRLVEQLEVAHVETAPLSAQASGRSLLRASRSTGGDASSPDLHQHAAPSAKAPASRAGKSVRAPSVAPSRTVRTAHTLQGSTATGGAHESVLDFASLRATHAAFLAFVLDGCLLSSPQASRAIRAILDACARFVGLVERWGGDVLPDLLMDGAGVDDDEEHAKRGSRTVKERKAALDEVAETLSANLDAFFDLLLDASSGPASAAAAGSTSLSAGAGLISGTAPPEAHRARATEARLDADSAARRHLEQLLLRLDFSGWWSARSNAGSAAPREDEHEAEKQAQQE